MATITIKSNNAEDIYFINELARRLNLETEIKTPENEIDIGQFKPVIDYEDTPEGVVEAIKRGLEFEKKLDAGLVKAQTLREMLDEDEN